jgi:hypothetical protein
MYDIFSIGIYEKLKYKNISFLAFLVISRGTTEKMQDTRNNLPMLSES